MNLTRTRHGGRSVYHIRVSLWFLWGHTFNVYDVTYVYDDVTHVPGLGVTSNYFGPVTSSVNLLFFAFFQNVFYFLA